MPFDAQHVEPGALQRRTHGVRLMDILHVPLVKAIERAVCTAHEERDVHFHAVIQQMIEHKICNLVPVVRKHIIRNFSRNLYAEERSNQKIPPL